MNRKTKFALTLIIATIVVGFGFIFSHVALAAVDTGVDAVGQTTGLGGGDVRLIIGNVIRVILGLLGAVALGFVLYGGFAYMTAGGDAEKASKARKILINAAIGLVIIFSSYAIASFVISKLTGATGAGGVDTSGNGNPGGLIISGGTESVLVANSITPQGNLGVYNVKVRVLFSRSVKADSITSASVVIKRMSGDVSVDGSYSVNGREVVFTPAQNCPAPNNNLNCFDKSEEFTVSLKPELIRSAAGDLSLTCAAGSVCQASFKTGESVDAEAPTVTFDAPEDGARVSVNSVVAGQITADDDSGISTVSVSVDNQLLTMMMPSGGFTQAFSQTFNWDTAAALVSLGQHTLEARAKDIDGHETTASIRVRVLPADCFDGSGNVVCGQPACGVCDGGGCSGNDDCASGECVNGVCATLPTIANVLPKEGSAGNFVTIIGSDFKSFVSGKSKVYFSNGSSYIEAGLGCASGIAWNNNQIIAKVPAGVTAGPIKVINSDNKYDTTDNNRGWKGDFVFNAALKYPGLCSVTRENCTANCESGLAAQNVQAVGANFGQQASDLHVYFGAVPANLGGSAAWQDAKISGVVIPNLTSGTINVSVGGSKICLDNNSTVCAEGATGCACTDVYSNPVQFRISDPLNKPKIQSINPNPAPAGQLVTVLGNNFGTTVGRVEFVSQFDATRYVAELSCGQTGWSDVQVAAKVPAKLTGDKIGNYDVIVYNSDNMASDAKTFVVNSAIAGPGLCSLTPENGPTGTMFDVSGENLGVSSQYNIKFTKSKDAITIGSIFSGWTDTALTGVMIPSDAVTGSVYLESKAAPVVVSNKLQLKVGSCKADTDCAVGNACCGNGICVALNGQAKNKVCGEQSLFLPSEFAWVISTGALPNIPRVLERTCVTGYLPQSPSPAKTSQDACPNGTISATFNMEMNAASFNNNITIKRCKDENATCDLDACAAANCLKTTLPDLSASDLISTNLNVGNCVKGGKSCQAGSGADCVCSVYGLVTNVNLVDSLGNGAVADGLFAVVGSGNSSRYELKKNTWYQVEINGGKNGVSSSSGEVMPNSYKWSFKTKSVDCAPDNLLMSPAKGLIKELTGVQSYLVSGQYKCQSLALNDKPWYWSVDTQTVKASVKGYGCSGSQQICTGDAANVRMDIGVYGINRRAVDGNGNARISLETGDTPIEISASASVPESRDDLRKGGKLEIKLAEPKVTSYFPNCQAACVNAGLGARFSVNMKPAGFNAANIKLYSCASDNCTEQTAVNLTDNDINYQSDVAELQINPSVNLSSNTFYRVVIMNVASGSGKALGGLNYHLPETTGTAQNAFSWIFKTKNDSHECAVASVAVQPDDYKSQTKGETIQYLSVPRSSPDSCNAQGQALNPYRYDWAWNSTQTLIADVSRNTYNKNFPTYCTAGCLLKGGNNNSTGAVCGNAIVESPAEQCETGDVKCTGKCLWKGTDACAAGQSGGCCGNGVVEPGEECDAACNKEKSACKLTDIAGTPVYYFHYNGSANGVSHNMNSTADRNGNLNSSYSFNGQSSYVDAGHDAALKISTGVTVAAWVKREGNASGEIVNRGGGWSEDGYSMFWIGNNFRVELQNTSKHEKVSLDNTVPSDDAWHHFAFTWDSDTKNVTAYIDGEAQPNTVNFNGPIGIPAQNLNVGRDEKMGSYFNGAIDEALLYNKKLTDAQIADIYSGQATSSCQCGLPVWCSNHCLLLGSNIKYNSICGNGAVENGEISVCDSSTGSGSGYGPYQIATVKPTMDISNADVFRFNSVTGFTEGNSTISATEQSSSIQGAGKLTYQTTECNAESVILDDSTSWPVNNAQGVCRNVLISLTFNGVNESSFVGANNVKLYKYLSNNNDTATCLNEAQPSSGAGLLNKIQNFVEKILFKVGLAAGDSCEVASSAQAGLDSLGNLKISVAPGGLLEKSHQYKVELTGLKDSCNRAISGKTITFNTSDKVCLLNNVAIDPADTLVTEPNHNAIYSSTAKSDYQPIQSIAGVYSWSWGSWKSMDNSIAKVDVWSKCATTGQSSDLHEQCVATLTKNGTTQIKATATIEDDKISPQSTKGASTVGIGQVQVFICDNIWYSDYDNDVSRNAYWGSKQSLLSNGKYSSTYLYEKGPSSGKGYDVGLFYCRDFGKAGFADDLPKLKIVTDSSIVASTADPLLAQYFFTRNTTAAAPENDNATGDVISLRIYKNLNSLPPDAWYRANVPNPGSTTHVDIDCVSDDSGKYCFSGAQDGPSLYIAAPNISNSSIYNNIYLLGYSRGANAATQNIYSQLVNFIKFNVQHADTIARKLALRRDMVRLSDIAYINQLIIRYKNATGKVPQLESGSYVRGRTFSVWPSWQSGLGSVLGATLPTDPLNYFKGGSCPAGYDNKTCYDSVSQVFYSAVYDAHPSESPLYSYQKKTNTTYDLLYQLETATQYSGYSYFH